VDVGGWGVIQKVLFDRVLEEPGDGGLPPGNGRAGPAPGLEFPGKAFDVGAADSEQGQGVDTEPGSELAQVQRVSLPGQAAVSGQEPGKGKPFGVGEGRRNCTRAVDGAAVVIGHLPAGLEPGSWASSGPSGLTEPKRKVPARVTLCHRRPSGAAGTAKCSRPPTLALGRRFSLCCERAQIMWFCAGDTVPEMLTGVGIPEEPPRVVCVAIMCAAAASSKLR
jgi:hypothetical protein